MKPLSSRTELYLLILAIVLVLAACIITAYAIIPALLFQAPTPTPVGTTLAATPTPAPVACENRWGQIRSTGRLVVGVSADYPPFEYYNAQFQIDGFDPALMVLIGQQLGLQVSFVDFAFEGLNSALELGQIDAAISAISVTPERQSFVDFTNIYFYGLDSVLAGQNFPLANITSVSQMAGYRVGVQSGTVYEQYLTDNLVNTGQMPSANLHSYARMDQAINDLRNGLIDLVMLDRQPALDFMQAGGLKIVSEGLNPQSYAIAACKGNQELVNQLNQAISALSAQGALSLLEVKYMQVSPAATPLPTPTAAPPQPTSTPAPPPPCIDGMAYVADLNYPDYNMKNPPLMSPGQPFIKGWRIRNSGTCPWTSTYSLGFASGNVPAASMGGQRTYIQGNVPPGATYDIYVNMVAPVVPGVYQGFWQMLSSISYPFGQKIWVGIQVVPNATSTPKPSQTPSPAISFSANPTTINTGDAVTFSWSVAGAQAVYFYAQGQPWQDNPVVAQGGRTVFPPQSMTYELRVVWPGGNVEVRQIYITVIPPPPNAPQITQFSTTPPNQIALGQCLIIQWAVQGQVSSVNLLRDNAVILGNTPLNGSYQDCPSQAGQVVYAIEATGPGGTSRQQLAITVLAPTPTDMATATLPPPPPQVNTFVVDPLQIQLGACVNMTWTIGGTVDNVQLERSGTVIQAGAPLNGSAQDCPTQAGQITYQIVATNNAGQSDSKSATVTVEQAPAANPLAGTSWQLTDYLNTTKVMQPPLEGTTVNLSFQADQTLNGSASCNTYNGPYTVVGNQLTVGSLSTSLQECSTPAGIMDQEDEYLGLLRSVVTFQVQGNTLLLSDSDGRIVLQYESMVQPR